jgi:hypothetical protein
VVAQGLAPCLVTGRKTSTIWVSVEKLATKSCPIKNVMVKNERNFLQVNLEKIFLNPFIYLFYLLLFFYMSNARVERGRIQTCDFHFIRYDLQSIELPLGDFSNPFKIVSIIYKHLKR